MRRSAEIDWERAALAAYPRCVSQTQDESSAGQGGHEMRVPAKGSWTVDIPEGMTRIDNGDSWQAYDERVVVYVSSLSTPDELGGKRARAEIAAVAAAKVPASAELDRLSYDNGVVIGHAAVGPADSGWRLTGSAATDGTLVTCIIDFAHLDDRDQVEGIWRSLYCPSEALIELAFLALDHAIDSVSEGGSLIPFLFIERSDGRELQRFASGTLEEGQAAMREAVAELDERATAYAMAYDGCMTFEGKKWDAILSEAAEHGAPSGVFFVQRYQPKKGLFGKSKAVGNAALIPDREGQPLGGQAG